MKTLFNWLGAAALGAGLVGCVDLEAAPLPEDTDGSASEDSGGQTGVASTSQGTTTAGESSGDPTGDSTGDPTDSGCGDDCAADPHGLSGELMLFVNARLSSAEALYQSNVPLEQDGTFVGPRVYLYDPLAQCDGGGNGCRLAELGGLLLDERLGSESVTDGSLRKFTMRDLAWSADRGLWGVSFDTKNDEWGISYLDVPDWSSRGNLIGVDRYAVLPGDPQSPSTDPCYWQEGVSGLGFFGDELLLGVRGLGGSGIPTNGMIYRVDLDVIESDGHCVYANDVSQDPSYYACDVLCEPWARFDAQVGVSGDVVEHPSGSTVLAMVRAEDDSLMPMDRQILFEAAPPVSGEVATPSDLGIYADGVPQGLDIEGMAWVQGRLFGIDVWGKVYEFDLDGRIVREHDDLSGLFTDFTQSLKIRGATGVELP